MRPKRCTHFSDCDMGRVKADRAASQSDRNGVACHWGGACSLYVLYPGHGTCAMAYFPAAACAPAGAGSNRAGRFEAHDGARPSTTAGICPRRTRLVRTEVRIERPRSALSYNRSPDLPFDRSINPYRGCEHGCIYCFARPSHAFLNLSPGLDFETRLIARPGIGAVLARELSAKRLRAAGDRDRHQHRPLPARRGASTG